MENISNNKATLWATILVVVFIIVGGGIYLKYYFSMQNANEQGKQMKCNENREQSFTGIITEINRYNKDEFMHKNFFCLSIKTTDTLNKFVDYQFNLEPNKNILDFAQPGQRISKEKGKNIFTITNTTGQYKTYKIPYCD